MTFAGIPAGAAVFVDANTFIYHFTADVVYGAACTALLDRIDNLDIEGITSAHVLGELAHRLMTLEAQQRFGWPATGMAHRLKRHPAEVQQLSWHKRGIDEVRAIGVRVLAVEGGDVSQAADASGRLGLLHNDALVVVLMQRHGLSHLASADTDFDRVPGLTRYHPL
jgi:predicted nucleic acid-binding protein